jgi:formylmethanofuran dehydrogenase subunit E
MSTTLAECERCGAEGELTNIAHNEHPPASVDDTTPESDTAEGTYVCDECLEEWLNRDSGVTADFINEPV